MKTSNFYRLYVDGYRDEVLINTDNMADALRVASMWLDRVASMLHEDETTCNVRLVRAHEKSIDLEEIRNCAILTLGKEGANDE